MLAGRCATPPPEPDQDGSVTAKVQRYLALAVGTPPPPPPPAPPIRKKSKSRSARPQEFTIATPRAQPPSRDVSVASTIRYPTPEPPRAQVARTIAREELNRSRSRAGAPEPMLPIAEEEVLSRGRQMTRKPEGPMTDRAKALLKKQEHDVTMGE